MKTDDVIFFLASFNVDIVKTFLETFQKFVLQIGLSLTTFSCVQRGRTRCKLEIQSFQGVWTESHKCYVII